MTARAFTPQPFTPEVIQVWQAFAALSAEEQAALLYAIWQPDPAAFVAAWRQMSQEQSEQVVKEMMRVRADAQVARLQLAALHNHTTTA